MADLTIYENMARMMLKTKIKEADPTENDIHEIVSNLSLVMPELSESEKTYIEKQLQASYKVRMDLGVSVVQKATYNPWLRSRKAHIDFYYWNRYYKYLLLEKGWTDNVIDTLGEVSDDILDLCGNPEEKGTWLRKGLVFGDVQSGKTSNYLALCNKAADAGYKLIILLTGTIENLRQQTQDRIDYGMIGVDSRNCLEKNPERKYVGVGQQDCNRIAIPFTTILSDFNSSKLEALNFTISGFTEPVILVIKKNKSVLENLKVWLNTRNKVSSNPNEKIDFPLLLIDDEADNASVNTNKEDKDPTAINKSIVEILQQFNRASYVAVTATPFANIFIDSDLDTNDKFNLFPSDFIYALKAPTNYIGAEQIFGDDAEYSNCLERIKDVIIDENNGVYVFRSKAKSNHHVEELPNSLLFAIKYFLLINAVMDLDGNTTSHRSMLINVSQFVNVQTQVFDLVKKYLNFYQKKIQSYSKLPLNEALQYKEINELQEAFINSKLGNISGYTFESVLEKLYEATSPIQMRLVNQKAKERGLDPLDYEPYKKTGLRVIAIGGNSLSRGLTLEGLCVSYFDRNSQMYDTLMQMGRWFGYRKGYEHLFKIWMEPAAIEWYKYITRATIELREEILEMKSLGLTPKDFGLKVQQNQAALFVTARNKMRATTVVEQWISLSAEVIETPKLIANIDTCLQLNLKTTNDLLLYLINNDYRNSKLEYGKKNRAIFTGVDKNIIAEFVRNFKSHPRHIPFNSKDLSEHIEKSENFDKWTVAIVGGSGDLLNSTYFPKNICDLNISYSSRLLVKEDSCLLISGQRARVGVPGATKMGLDDVAIKQIEEKFKSEHPDKKTIPDKPYLRNLSNKREPILLIYPIQPNSDTDEATRKLIGDFPIIALGLGFPGTGNGEESEKVHYVLNRVGERLMDQFEEEFEDDDECD